ncbi:unnamed protein product [Arctia plantaginis]|uniref:Uncharacterized protein n=1 Tax=Arctia plantaginis TaxID=874455 RepID=A0A8S0YS31_ARCPL|nr:unnamed protein product [Arctia plantaginis]
MAGEKLSNDEAAIGPFQLELQKVIREKKLTAEQVYNADESRLYWRLLPDHTLASGNEHPAFNRSRGPNDPQISEAEAQEWAAGGAESELQRYEVLTDEEIVRAAMCEDDEEDEDNSVEILKITKVGNSEAVGALNTALKWAEDNEFDSHEVMFLRRLRDRAFEMKCENYKQKSITDFFKKN